MPVHPNTYKLSLCFIMAGLLASGRNAVGQEDSRPPVAGLYVGAFAGAVALDSTVRFNRTATRPETKIVDQGGDGDIYTLRAGWGRMISRRGYAGVEIEGNYPHNVNSRFSAFGTEYRARLRSDAGVFGRIGFSTDGQSMMFFRGGLTAPRQSFESVQGGNTSRSGWNLVPTAGFGAEVPLGRSSMGGNYAGRVDITYSYPTGQNRIESYRLTAGVVYRF